MNGQARRDWTYTVTNLTADQAAKLNDDLLFALGQYGGSVAGLPQPVPVTTRDAIRESLAELWLILRMAWADRWAR